MKIKKYILKKFDYDVNVSNKNFILLMKLLDKN